MSGFSPPFDAPLYGDRGVDFVAIIGFVGADYTGAATVAKVRPKPDSSATAIVFTVTMPYAGTATVAAHVAAGRMTTEIYKKTNVLTGNLYQPTDSIPFTQFKLTAPSTDMVTPKVPNATRVGDNVNMAWDILVTPSGGTQFKLFAGAFVVRGVVAHA